jgi:tRNA-modifying protein YgfZ
MNRLPLLFSNDLTDPAHRLGPRPDDGVLVIEGPEAERFLQGQITIDIHRLALGDWQIAAQCTPKGRMRVSGVITRLGPERFGFRMDRRLLTYCLDTLKPYATFFKVTLSITDWAVYWALSLREVAPPQLPTAIAILRANLPTMADTRTLIEYWVPATTSPEQLQAAGYSLDQRLAGKLAWHCGWAWVSLATRERFLPQSFNYDQQSGIHFNKGCYTGQEIIARLHYKGDTKERLFHAIAKSEQAFPGQLGDSLLGPDGQRLGTLVAASSEMDAHNQHQTFCTFCGPGCQDPDLEKRMAASQLSATPDGKSTDEPDEHLVTGWRADAWQLVIA